jgi:hypothetical protein
VLLPPVVLQRNASLPIAVLLVPVVLFNRALLPIAVLLTTLPPPNPTLTVLKVESEVVVTEPDTKTLCVNGLT